MAEVIIMPKLGFNMSEGKLVKWYKSEGDPVAKGEPIFAIETDKTSIDIEATLDGIFRKKFIEEGDTSPVTLPIAIISAADENIDALIADVNKQLNRQNISNATAETQEEISTATTAPVPVGTAQSNGDLKITPRAKRLALDQGLSLASINIAGTGWNGGICEKDLIAYLAENKVKATPLAQKAAEANGISLKDIQGTGAHGKIMEHDIVKAAVRDVPAQTFAAETGNFSPDGKEILEEIPYSGVRKIIGDRLSQSKFTAPHLYFTQKVNLDKLLELRQQVNKAQDRKVSVTDFIAKATVMTLQKYPEMNSSLINEKIVRYKTVNLGIAVASPVGLIVPVVKDAAEKSVVQISKESGALFDKARNGKLSPSEYTGGTFTISNLGMFGIENFTAIINPPEAGILAISSMKDEVFVETDANGNKSICIKPMMNITLSVDHRLIDGLLAAQFVTAVKKMLEDPIGLMV